VFFTAHEIFTVFTIVEWILLAHVIFVVRKIQYQFVQCVISELLLLLLLLMLHIIVVAPEVCKYKYY